MNRNKGFTIIEMLVAVALIGFTFSGTVAYYRDFQAKRDLREQAEELKKALRWAASRARNNETSGYCAGPDGKLGTSDDYPLQGWYVEPQNYRYYAKCNNEEVMGGSFKSYGSVSMSVDGPHEILFAPLGNDGDSAKITLRRDDKRIIIQVNSKGAVVEEVVSIN